MNKRGKLELTWVGKYDEKIIEPRILVEDKSKSYGDPNSENMLIHGDNLIALQALLQDYAGKIKCIYIDPPYNTGKAFNTYDDNLEQSIWLTLIRDRLVCLRQLLSDDGVIYIQINDDEYPYLKVLCDEVFGKNNYETTFYVKVRHENRILREDTRWQLCMEQVLCYRKTAYYVAPRRPKEKDATVDYKWEVNVVGRPKETVKIGSYDVEIYDSSAWSYKKVSDGEGHFKQYQIRGSLITQKGSASEYYEMFLRQRREQDGLGALYKVVGMGVNGDGLGYRFIMQPEKEQSKNGFYFQGLPKKTTESKGLPYPNFYDMTVEFNNAGYEGYGYFNGGKKPEAWIDFLLSIADIKEGEYVLDSFLGSGTTAAVCMKRGYNFIGIEMEDNNAYELCKPRLDMVIKGKDEHGIETCANVKMGYHFYELAPSLLVKNDKIPIYQINPEYTFEMLCEAICKIEGFRYKPDGIYHGNSSEKRFIHITKEFVNAEYVMSVAATLGEGQSLLIYGTKIQSNLVLPDNIEVKKIPKDLLEKCDFESEVR